MYTLVYLETKPGCAPFIQALERFDASVQHRVHKLGSRFKAGNFGHTRFLGGGVYESKLDFGAGIRIYFGIDRKTVVILILCGNKATQSKDIFSAKRLWNGYLEGKRDVPHEKL
jgi:putative addiction module killer protein